MFNLLVFLCLCPWYYVFNYLNGFVVFHEQRDRQSLMLCLSTKWKKAKRFVTLISFFNSDLIVCHVMEKEFIPLFLFRPP